MTNTEPVATRERTDARAADCLRPLTTTLGIAPHAHGSVLIGSGKTQVICAVTIEPGVPRWMKEQGVKGGWLTAEYSMLPYSTLARRPRDINKGKLDGRSTEIQRLIGRALRTAIDLETLGERTVWIDCDVLQADGGTRTAAITGSSLALVLACDRLQKEDQLLRSPLKSLVAAVSVGIVDRQPLLDLDYEEDKNAAVDLNLVMNSAGEFVEVQGSGEEATFSQDQLNEMLRLGRMGVSQLFDQQRTILRGALIDLAEEL
jgi:ribonuclease PH